MGWVFWPLLRGGDCLGDRLRAGTVMHIFFQIFVVVVVVIVLTYKGDTFRKTAIKNVLSGKEFLRGFSESSEDQEE